MDSELSSSFSRIPPRNAADVRVHRSVPRKLTEDQIWGRGAEHENSVGNLILHVCGNARQWIIAGSAARKTFGSATFEFSNTRRLCGGRFARAAQGTVEQAIAVIEVVTPERLLGTIIRKPARFSVLEAILPGGWHFQQTHRGKLFFATKNYVAT